MATYTFSPTSLSTIVSHIEGLDMEIVSLSFVSGTYHLILNGEFDEEQYDHLRETTDLERQV